MSGAHGEHPAPHSAPLAHEHAPAPGQLPPPVQRAGAIRTTLGEELPVSVRGPRILTLLGAALLIIGVSLGIFGLTRAMSTVESITGSADGSGDGTIAVASVPGEASLALEAGSTYGLLLVRDGSTPSTKPAVEADDLLITATAPDGTELVPVDGASVEAATGAIDAVVITRYTAQVTGVHTFTIMADAAVLDLEGAPTRSDTTVVIGPDTIGSDLVQAVVWLILGPLVGFGLAAIGFFMGTGGGLWWGLRATSRRHQRARTLPSTL